MKKGSKYKRKRMPKAHGGKENVEMHVAVREVRGKNFAPSGNAHGLKNAHSGRIFIIRAATPA